MLNGQKPNGLTLNYFQPLSPETTMAQKSVFVSDVVLGIVNPSQFYLIPVIKIRQASIFHLLHMVYKFSLFRAANPRRCYDFRIVYRAVLEGVLTSNHHIYNHCDLALSVYCMHSHKARKQRCFLIGPSHHCNHGVAIDRPYGPIRTHTNLQGVG